MGNHCSHSSDASLRYSHNGGRHRPLSANSSSSKGGKAGHSTQSPQSGLLNPHAIRVRPKMMAPDGGTLGSTDTHSHILSPRNADGLHNSISIGNEHPSSIDGNNNNNNNSNNNNSGGGVNRVSSTNMLDDPQEIQGADVSFTNNPNAVMVIGANECGNSVVFNRSATEGNNTIPGIITTTPTPAATAAPSPLIAKAASSNNNNNNNNYDKSQFSLALPTNSNNASSSDRPTLLGTHNNNNNNNNGNSGTLTLPMEHLKSGDTDNNNNGQEPLSARRASKVSNALIGIDDNRVNPGGHLAPYSNTSNADTAILPIPRNLSATVDIRSYHQYSLHAVPMSSPTNPSSSSAQKLKDQVNSNSANNTSVLSNVSGDNSEKQRNTEKQRSSIFVNNKVKNSEPPRSVAAIETRNKTLREIWDRANAHPGLARRFYENLHIHYPQLTEMLFFGVDIDKQSKKMLDMLDLGIKNLDRIDLFSEVLLKLGVRHLSYGTQEHHFDAIFECMCIALKEYLPPDLFTKEFEENYLRAMQHIKHYMVRGFTQPNLSIKYRQRSMVAVRRFWHNVLQHEDRISAMALKNAMRHRTLSNVALVKGGRVTSPRPEDIQEINNNNNNNNNKEEADSPRKKQQQNGLTSPRAAVTTTDGVAAEMSFTDHFSIVGNNSFPEDAIFFEFVSHYPKMFRDMISTAVEKGVDGTDFKTLFANFLVCYKDRVVSGIKENNNNNNKDSNNNMNEQEKRQLAKKKEARLTAAMASLINMVKFTPVFVYAVEACVASKLRNPFARAQLESFWCDVANQVSWLSR